METIIETWRLIFSRKTSLLQVEIVFLASEKQFFSFVRTVFPSSGNVFLTDSSFRLVETGFLSHRKSIFFIQRFTKRIFKRILQSVWWRCIFCPVETVFSYLIFFSTSGNRHWKYWKPIFGEKNFIPASKKRFSVWWKLYPFFILCFFPASQNRYWN